MGSALLGHPQQRQVPHDLNPPIRSITMRNFFFSFVILATLGLVGILMSAVLVDYKMLDRVYFDLLLVATLCVAIVGMCVGFFLEILE
jgi:hypothetical protein